MCWNEEDSQTFIDRGRYFVPERERQMALICDLIPPRSRRFEVLELCCGAGLLAEAILARHPQAFVHALDGSALMRQKARERLQPFAGRFDVREFDLAAADWRRPEQPFQAVVSSLCIHHLEHQEKEALYAAIYRMLAPGGVFLLADLVEPAGPLAQAAAAAAWDEAVRRRALALDGHEGMYTSFRQWEWNIFRSPDPVDKPAPIASQLAWLATAGFGDVDVYWLAAGHALFGGRRAG